MKKFLVTVLSGAGALLAFTGCNPDLAQIPLGPDEAEWCRQLRSNYSEFQPPRTPAPATYNRGNPIGDAPVPAGALPAAPNSPEDDPGAVVDRAASGQAVAPPKERPAAKPEAKPEAKPAAQPAAKSGAGVAAKPEVLSKPYIVRPGDTLTGLAKRFYGQSSLEDVIYKANLSVIKDRNRLQPGMSLAIPQL